MFRELSGTSTAGKGERTPTKGGRRDVRTYSTSRRKPAGGAENEARTGFSPWYEYYYRGNAQGTSITRHRQHRPKPRKTLTWSRGRRLGVAFRYLPTPPRSMVIRLRSFMNIEYTPSPPPLLISTRKSGGQHCPSCQIPFNNDYGKLSKRLTRR